MAQTGYSVPARGALGAGLCTVTCWRAAATVGVTWGAKSSIFRFLKNCSWVNRLYGIGGRLRRLQRPGVVFLKAIMVHTKSSDYFFLDRISEDRKVVNKWKCDKNGQPWLLLKKRHLGMVDASSVYKSPISLYAGPNF